MIGQRLGHKPGHYFVVMTVEIDSHIGYKTTATQTDTVADAQPDVAAEQFPPEGRDGSAPPMSEGEEEIKKTSRLPLVYVEVVNQKAEAASATERLLAQLRDEHGHLPTHAVFRLHSDKGQ